MTKRAPNSVTPTSPWVEAFRAGTHTDMSGTTVTFSEAQISDIADAVNAQVAGGYTPPLVVGHPRTDSPRVGSVMGAKAENGILKLKVDELTPEFAEAARKGQYKYTSVALYRDNGLRHLGVLGGTAPAVKGLEPICFGEGEFAEVDAGKQADQVLMFAQEMSLDMMFANAITRLFYRLRSFGSLLRSQREAMIADKGLEAADKIYPAYLVQDLESIEAPDFSKASDNDDGSPAAAFSEPASIDAGNAELERLRAENEILRKADTERRATEASAAFATRLDGLVKDGKLLPVQRTKLEALHKELVADGLQFAETDPRLTALDGFLDVLPKQLEFGEFQGRPRIPSTKNPLLADAEARGGKA